MYWMSGKAGCGKVDSYEDLLVEGGADLLLREFISCWIDIVGTVEEVLENQRACQWHAGSIYSTFK